MGESSIALAVDTSTRYAVVGVSRDGQSLAELSWRSERNHSVELVPALRRVLAQSRLELDDVEAIYLAIGPGGFSALRVGISTAMTIAMARDIPLVKMGTLEVEAHPYRGLGRPVTALIGAGRSRLYVGRFEDEPSPADSRVYLSDRKEFLDGVDADTLFCGEAAVELRDDLMARLGHGITVVNKPPPSRSASVMAHIGFAKLRSGETAGPGDIEPIYLRSSQLASADRRRQR